MLAISYPPPISALWSCLDNCATHRSWRADIQTKFDFPLVLSDVHTTGHPVAALRILVWQYSAGRFLLRPTLFATCPNIRHVGPV